MFYYAEINSDYLVTNTHSLNQSSTNANYIAITEEQYTNGDLVGKYYNSLTDNFEKIDTYMNYIGDAEAVTYKNTEMMLSTLVDNMQVEMDSKADENHIHTEYASSDDLALLEDVINTKANATHTHSEYASVSHTHNGYATQVALDTLSEEVDGKATISHTHNDYATTDALSELSATVSNKANASHSHNDTYYTESEIDTKLSAKSDTSHTHTGVYDASGAAASALTSANAYTDTEIDVLSETVATKANTSDLTSHTGNTTVHITSTERNNWNAAKTHANSAHAPSNAEENQNAFSNIVVGSTTISADTKTDTFTLVAGNNVILTPDSTGDSVIISSANTVYTHPTTAGNKHIPAGGSSGQILRWSADGTAVWGSDNNTTYSNATQTTSGLMSDIDKTKLDGIAEGANKYTLPSAGSSLGGVKTGGDVTISSGVITVNDDSHNHIISNVDGLQSALDAKASSSHDHNSVYYTETEVDTLLSGKANTSHGTHVSYSTTVPVMDGSASVGTASTVARSDHKHPIDTSRASQTDLNTHTSNKSNPHGVTLTQLGVTATASELNKMDGVTATTTELNYVDGVTSNIQTQLNGKAASSHTHNYAGSSSAGGVATSANKLATARTISLTGDVSGSTSFDGSGNVSITATVADDSHNHTIANVDGLQSALDGKSATSHNHNSAYVSKNLQMTSDDGNVSISWSGKDVLAQFKALASGMYTAYSPAGATNNPNTLEGFRFMCHKTGSASYGWVMAYGTSGSVYTGYLNGGTWQGWKALWEYAPQPLWSGGANGGYYMTATHTITPTKKLSECRNGWALLWSDYDVGGQANNTDFYVSYIYKRAYTGQVWGGGEWYCDIPSYSAGTATDSEQRVIKLLQIYDAKIVGTENNAAAPRNDVVLRAVYEF